MSMTKIATATVGAGGAASIDFTSIPASFTDIKIVASLRASNANTDGNVTFNGSTADLTSRQLYGQTSNSTAGSATNASKILSYALADASTYTSGAFGNVQIYVPNYSSTTISKSVSIDAVIENNAGNSYLSIVAGLWASSSAINQVTLKADTGNLAEYSTATLYGVKDATKYYPQATGGSITADANYIYHTFTASGTFTPTVALTADVLVVAAGGGGGLRGSRGSGGGGAGGLLSFASQALTATPYTITIGAGGAGGTTSNGYGGGSASRGNDSRFGALTLVYGGGGGENNSLTTGSQGGTSNDYGASTNWTPSQGNAGGTSTTPSWGGGGGGGAGATGSNSAGNNGGNGGVGVNGYSAWATATGTGSSGYYASGGGGGAYPGGTPGNGGLGGGANGSTGAYGNAAVANTGGGGGGIYTTTSSAAGGSGGSGLVIVRYPK